MKTTNNDTLDVVIRNIIEINGPLKAREIYKEIIINNSYRKQNGDPVSINQVNARISNYKHIFWRDKNHYIHIKDAS